MSETSLTMIQPKVIDPDDQAEMERFARLHDEAWKRVRDRHPDRVGTPTWEIAAEQFRLFRDPTYRVKPDEPTGLGAVVEDENGVRHVRTVARVDDSDHLDKPWSEGPVRRNWQIVPAVRVLSEGVQP